MARPLGRIRVMLSSRNMDLVPCGSDTMDLKTVRIALQAELQGERFCGERLLDVWINETAGATEGTSDSWAACMNEVDDADLVVVIYNGSAGWTEGSADVGICHAEFERVLSRSPSKIRLIVLKFDDDPIKRLVSPETLAKGLDRDKRYADAIKKAGLFRGLASDAENLKLQVRLAVTSGVVDLARVGSREARKGKYYFGSPLDWSRLQYTERKQVIETSIAEYLKGSRSGVAIGPGIFQIALARHDVLFPIHGIPSAFGTAEARDLVGRAHLRDHEGPIAGGGEDLLGPVHVFACHKRATESQINAFFGHPDLVLVQAPFGFFVADPFNFVQAFFLLDCRDDSSTRVACQRMFDWVERSGEASRIVARAASRARVLRTVAAEAEAGRAGLLPTGPASVPARSPRVKRGKKGR